jgi:hypothetical protein
VLFVRVLFTLSLTGLARYLANAFDPFCIYIVLVVRQLFVKCLLGNSKEEDMSDFRYHKTAGGAQEN